MKIRVISSPSDIQFDSDTIAIVERLDDGWHIFTPDGEEYALGGGLSAEEAREATVSYLGQSVALEFEGE